MSTIYLCELSHSGAPEKCICTLQRLFLYLSTTFEHPGVPPAGFFLRAASAICTHIAGNQAVSTINVHRPVFQAYEIVPIFFGQPG